MDLHLRRIVILVLALSATMVGCNHGGGVGPQLASEQKARQIALDKAGLTSIDLTELTTAGPIYRFVIGEDKQGNKIAVWIENDVVYREKLENGISRSEVLELARTKGFDQNAIVQLIYVPPVFKQKVLTFLNDSTSDVFWWIRTPDAEASHQIFVNFYDGSIDFEK